MTHHDLGASWFLAQVKPNCHQIAERNLRRQDFRTFQPMQEETKRRQEKFTSSLRPLFPGYLFVAFDTHKGGWRTINSTYGITKLVSFGADPTPVPLDLISGLMLRCDQDGRLLPAPLLKAGDTVEIVGGPFAEFIATVDSIALDKRVWVLLDLMGRATRVVVDASAVRTV